MGHLLAYLELLIRVGNGQRLLVRIDGNKLATLCAGLYHSIYDVVTGAADIAGDVITGAGDIVNDAATGAGEAASKAVSDAAR